MFCGFCLIYAHVGGYGFKTRCVRAINCLGFLCFGDQVTAREKRRVMCGPLDAAGCAHGMCGDAAVFDLICGCFDVLGVEGASGYAAVLAAAT